MRSAPLFARDDSMAAHDDACGGTSSAHRRRERRWRSWWRHEQLSVSRWLWQPQRSAARSAARTSGDATQCHISWRTVTEFSVPQFVEESVKMAQIISVERVHKQPRTWAKVVIYHPDQNILVFVGFTNVLS